MRARKAVSILTVLVLIAFSAMLMVSCAKKGPEGPMTPAEGSSPGTGRPGAWTPEAPPTPSLEVESSADAFNRQGVLKKIYFDTNKAEIRDDARAVLKENAAWILAHAQFTVTIEGHCDERNTEAYNLALGERRANAAKEYLIGLGVQGSRIQTVSYGKSRPVCTEHNEDCWQRNRRDEFVLQEAK